jgi:hypothetical protein
MVVGKEHTHQEAFKVVEPQVLSAFPDHRANRQADLQAKTRGLGQPHPPSIPCLPTGTLPADYVSPC